MLNFLISARIDFLTILIVQLQFEVVTWKKRIPAIISFVVLNSISSASISAIYLQLLAHLTHIIFYSNVYNKMTKKLILTETLEYIRRSERFKVLEGFLEF